MHRSNAKKSSRAAHFNDAIDDNKEENKMSELKYEIVEEIMQLSESLRGWTKELNLVSWNERDPKYDLREWAPDHEKMGKGITLTSEELKKLRDSLNKLNL